MQSRLPRDDRNPLQARPFRLTKSEEGFP